MASLSIVELCKRAEKAYADALAAASGDFSAMQQKISELEHQLSQREDSAAPATNMVAVAAGTFAGWLIGRRSSDN